ncbi:nucleoside hydrolase [Rothia sp. ZJ932]|nr:nucleoside hydrolase [Rothia sp. ZJ1223]QRZ62651.1 nucleoside hydrolase [Rothia sp. ZJ932]
MKLLIDCDPGIDDLLALTYAVAHPTVDIVGIIASGGNVTTEQVARNVRGILTLTEASHVPWELGAENPLAQVLTTTPETHGPQGTGYAHLPDQDTHTGKTHGGGAHLWVETVNAHLHEVDAVVLGPSTNLALALELDPELPRKLRSIHIMGGALNHRGNTMPTTEWNVHSDPEALHRVLDAYSRPGLEHHPVICPLDATESIVMTAEYRQQLVHGDAGQAPTGILDAANEALRFYMEFHEGDGLGYIAHVHDPFVTALAVNSALARLGDTTALKLGQATSTTIDVELDGTLTRGQTIADWLGRWERQPNAQVLTGTRPPEFFDHFISTVRAAFAA